MKRPTVKTTHAIRAWLNRGGEVPICGFVIPYKIGDFHIRTVERLADVDCPECRRLLDMAEAA